MSEWVRRITRSTVAFSSVSVKDGLPDHADRKNACKENQTDNYQVFVCLLTRPHPPFAIKERWHLSGWLYSVLIMWFDLPKAFIENFQRCSWAPYFARGKSLFKVSHWPPAWVSCNRIYHYYFYFHIQHTNEMDVHSDERNANKGVCLLHSITKKRALLHWRVTSDDS